ncbi:Sensor histidine kinase/response regulator [Pseudomonas amygdali pv. tabaci]|uniref:histidine kinase n=1 Tax=Pseudomonas amygdali pv. tabaci TaxID=322 RepID=A0A3M6HCA3_PSEAJ|nr:Sensor histidine kinase/response regulator [Pseudomonas amygdali pv. tabaci]
MSLLPQRIDLEMTQALLRMAVIATSILYALIAYGMGEMSENKLFVILAYCMGFGVVTVGLIIRIAQRPGASGRRRLFALVTDNLAGIVTISVGGEAMLPVYSVMLSMTVGYGMRYGRNYLLLATGFSMISLMIIIVLTPFLREHHAVAVMMILTMLVLPLFVYFLLGRLHMALEETQAANQAKSRFLAQASHDLRQPIHSIGMFTACLRSSPLGDYERQLVDNIDRSLHNVSQLFRSILDIYTLDSGKVSAKSDVVNLGDMLNEVAHQNTAAARWAGVELRVRPCRRWVRVDATLLATMVQNIISNALKYAPDHPVLIGVRSHAGRLSISVYDRGRGIAAEHLPRVCDEFYRIRHVRDKDVEGVGLGLSIVKRLSQILNVQIAIVSRIDRGTTVTIHGLEEVSAPVRVVPKKALGESLLKGVRVCLVEDDQNVLMATAALLERWGCEVQTARSAEGLTTHCDIIVADYDLGTVANGLDCIESIRAARGWDVPALIVTGREVEVVLESMQGAEVSVLSKPLRPSELRLNLLSIRERRMSTP